MDVLQLDRLDAVQQLGDVGHDGARLGDEREHTRPINLRLGSCSTELEIICGHYLGRAERHLAQHLGAQVVLAHSWRRAQQSLAYKELLVMDTALESFVFVVVLWRREL